MKRVIIFLFVTLFFVGCAEVSNKGMKLRTVEDFYNSTGVEKYFLTDIPSWANFDQNASCYRSTNIRFFNLDSLMKSYGLSYNKALQTQAAFNEEFALFKGSDQNHVTTLKEEELLFYKVSEKVSSKIVFFDPPTFKQINLIWLDEILEDTAKYKKLKNFLNSKTMDLGVPVLLSFCLTRNEIENRFPDLNTKMITAEMLSVFNSTGSKSAGFKIELDQFFAKDQKINFYTQKKNFNSEYLKGINKILNY